MLTAALAILALANADAAEEGLQASDKPIGAPTVVVRRFENLQLKACVAALQAIEEQPREDEASTRKPVILGYECLVQPSTVPAGLAFPLDGRRILGIKPLPKTDPKLRCSVEMSLAADGVRVQARRLSSGYAINEKDVERCLVDFWKEHRLDEQTFELPLLLVPQKK